MDHTMNLPNLITIFRLLLTPYIVWLILSEKYILGFLCFILSGISDGLDGFLAKKFNQKTLLGSYLDPIADKFLIMSSIVLLGYNGFVPIWLVIIIVSRDIAILGAVIISWMLNTNLKIEPLIISKFNTFFQIFYIALIFFIIINDRYFISFQSILFELTTYLIALLTVVSWFSYLKVWLFNVSEVDKGNVK
tara:strand:+ start:1637 stop:2212 length:576 start_codon:yes stop_codon:yes gene_type:complete